MRKAFLGIMSAALLISASTSALAANVEKKETKIEVNTSDQQKHQFTTSWNYNGIQIDVISDRKLSDAEKVQFETKTNRAFVSSGTITPFSIPGEDPDHPIYEGPLYRTFDNTVTNFIVEGVVRTLSAYGLSKVPGGIWLQGVTQTWYSNMHAWLNTHSYTYNGLWTTKVYSSYYGYYEYWETLVFYTDSTYSTPTQVQYYNTGISMT